jgi:hypothetical protein
MLLEVGTISTLQRASQGSIQTAGSANVYNLENSYTSSNDPGQHIEYTYSTQTQSLYDSQCSTETWTCSLCLTVNRGITKGAENPQYLWSRVQSQEHVSGIGGDTLLDQGTLYITNNSLVVHTSHLHIEDYGVHVVNSTLFYEASMTIGRNGSFAISPYSANKDDFKTTSPLYSRGCAVSYTSRDILLNISHYVER